MAIVSYAYYTATYMGEAIAETDYPRIEARAERAIKQITHGRVTESNYSTLPQWQQEAATEAICAQIEYYAITGEDVSVNGNTGGNGWSIGEMRMNGTVTTAAKNTGAHTMICAAAIAALEQSGLMNPQVETSGDPAIIPWGWYVGN